MLLSELCLKIINHINPDRASIEYIITMPMTFAAEVCLVEVKFKQTKVSKISIWHTQANSLQKSRTIFSNHENIL